MNDAAPFVQALVNPMNFQSAYPIVPMSRADMNRDGRLNRSKWASCELLSRERLSAIELPHSLSSVPNIPREPTEPSKAPAGANRGPSLLWTVLHLCSHLRDMPSLTPTSIV